MKPISNGVRNRIVSELKSGKTTQNIAQKMGVGPRTVKRIRKEYADSTDDVNKAKLTKRGRPRRLSARDEAWVVRQITTGKADTATEVAKTLQEESGTRTTPKTIRRTLKKAGLKAAVKTKKPLLLRRHIKARYEFAFRHKHWTVDDWKRVVYSDETKINRLGSDGREWVWKKPGKTIEPRHVQGTVKFGGGSIMLWGCMTYDGIGYACRIIDRMNADLYVSILGDELMETIEYYDLDPTKLIFQQDNDSKHSSKKAKKWFEDNKIRILTWPAQSPDLNPIEHLWRHLKFKLNAYEEPPKGVEELWERVQKEWNAIPEDICTKLIDSMPRRIAAVYKAKGGYVKY